METFEFDGEKYKNASLHQKQWGNKLICEFELQGDEHILDLGCGDGVLTAQLAARVPHGHVIGIDASQGMIDTARKLATQNLTFFVQNINTLQFHNEFDLIFSNAALHWVKDHQTLLNNAFQALKDNGILRFNFAAEGNCAYLLNVIWETLAQQDYSDYFSAFEWPWFMPGIDEYKALLYPCPFQEMRIWGENADRYFLEAEAMIKWIDQPSLVPFLKYIDEPVKQQFRDAVVARMLEETKQEDETYFETFRRINVFARK